MSRLFNSGGAHRIWARHHRDVFDVATTGTIAFTAILCAALWLYADGTYFIKAMTESHNIVLVAENVRDFLTFMVQDVAASPDPAAHPFWYIHHPNIPAKTYSFLMGRLGIGLEGQIGVMLALNVLALIFVAAAFREFSSVAALAAVAVAATSYGSFHFNAGDLCRGPLYLMLWALLYALVTNPRLDDRARNIAIAAVCAMAILSDWGFALFVTTFSVCWACLGRERIPAGWALRWVLLPGGIAIAVYECAVIAAIGWDMFLLDVQVTYLGRLGVWDFDYSHLIEQYRQHLVLIWPSQSQGIDRLQQLIGSLLTAPLLNSGPIWIFTLPFAVWAAIRASAGSQSTRAGWMGLGLAAVLNVVGLLPLPVLVLALAWIVSQLPRVAFVEPLEKLGALLLITIIALLLPGMIFPGFTTGFTIAPGRPPFPLIEMAAAALLAQFVASGAATRLLWSPTVKTSFRSGRTIPSLVAVLVGIFALTLIAIAQSGPYFVGVPTTLAFGLVFVLAGSTALILTELCVADANTEAVPSSVFRQVLRWRYALFLSSATILLAAHKSSQPALLGRYSAGYLALLAAVAGLAVAIALLTASGSLQSVLRRAGQSLARSLARQDLLAGLSATKWLLLLAIVAQAGWLVLSIAGRPPQPIPYASLLKSAEYRGKSFLTTSYDPLVWEATRGWAYMPPGNPPKLNSISSRFRHFADWKNEAKYGRPDYFLCDNTGFSYVRPASAWEKDAARPMTCTACTCADVAAALAKDGHTIAIARPDYSIVRFNWPRN